MRWFIQSLSLVAVLLCSCQSPPTVQRLAVTESGIPSLEPYKVLVVGYAYDPKIRQQFEQEMVAALQKLGVEAYPSFERFPSLSQIQSRSLSQYLRSEAPAAVLFSEASSISKQEQLTSGRASGMSLFDTAGGDWESELIVKVSTSLFVSGQDRAVWRVLHELRIEDGSPIKWLVRDIVRGLPID